METSATLTTAAAMVALPADYILWRTVRKGAYPYYGELDYVHPAYLPASTLNGVPPVFTIEGNNFITRPIDDTADAWEFHYYQKIPALAGAGRQRHQLAAHRMAQRLSLRADHGGSGASAAIMEMAQLYKARRDEVFAEIIQRYALTTGATSPTVRTAEYF